MRVSLNIFYLLTGLLCFALKSSSAAGATVTKLSVKKKIVLIDEGEDAGFTKGAKVCFFKDNKKVACGTVSSSKKTSAVVKVSKRVKFVKKGQAATLDGAAATKKGGTSATSSTAVRFLYLPYFVALTPATYNLLTYTGTLSEDGASLWSTTGPYDAITLLSFGMEFEFSSMRLGGHYKAYTGYPVETDYDVQNPNLYASSLLSASAVGGYFDYVYLRAGDFTFAAGLDVDMTSVTLVTTRKDDDAVEEEIELYNVAASSSILSLRLPLRYEPNFGGMGLSFGVNLMLPLTSFGDSATAVVNDEVNGAKNADPEADAIAALGLTPASFALETVLGLSINF